MLFLTQLHPQIASCSHTIYFKKIPSEKNHVAPFKNQTFDPRQRLGDGVADRNPLRRSIRCTRSRANERCYIG
jgi:hypothetical protein